MKLTNTSLDELVITTVGEDVLPLIHILRSKNNISEFKLAEMLNITVNQVRNMLYRLNEQNLVDFIRRKDKKKGWYIYYWTLNKKSTEDALIRVKFKQLNDLKTRLDREQGSIFYVCPTGCMRLAMENAMEYEFRCQECGTLMKEQNNQKTIANIQKMVTELELEFTLVAEEKIKKSSRKIEKKVPVKKTKKIPIHLKVAKKKILTPKKEKKVAVNKVKKSIASKKKL